MKNNQAKPEKHPKMAKLKFLLRNTKPFIDRTGELILIVNNNVHFLNEPVRLNRVIRIGHHQGQADRISSEETLIQRYIAEWSCDLMSYFFLRSNVFGAELSGGRGGCIILNQA